MQVTKYRSPKGAEVLLDEVLGCFQAQNTRNIGQDIDQKQGKIYDSYAHFQLHQIFKHLMACSHQIWDHVNLWKGNKSFNSLFLTKQILLSVFDDTASLVSWCWNMPILWHQAILQGKDYHICGYIKTKIKDTISSVNSHKGFPKIKSTPILQQLWLSYIDNIVLH